MEGARVGPKGTRAAPRMVPSHFGKRIVGCICKFLSFSAGSSFLLGVILLSEPRSEAEATHV